MSLVNLLNHILQPAVLIQDSSIILNSAALKLLGPIQHLTSVSGESILDLLEIHGSERFKMNVLDLNDSALALTVIPWKDQLLLLEPQQQNSTQSGNQSLKSLLLTLLSKCDQMLETRPELEHFEDLLFQAQTELERLEESNRVAKSSQKIQQEITQDKTTETKVIEPKIIEDEIVEDEIVEDDICSLDHTFNALLEKRSEFSSILNTVELPQRAHLQIKPSELTKALELILERALNEATIQTQISIYGFIFGRHILIDIQDNISVNPDSILIHERCHHQLKHLLTPAGGEIKVSNTPQLGTKYTLKLTISEESAVIKPHQSPKINSVQNTLYPVNSSKSILLVEPDPHLLEIHQRLLSGSFLVDTATTGREALDLLNKHDYDLILTELMVPNGSGMDLYASLELQAPELCPRFLFLTSSAEAPETQRFVQRVPNLILGKPCPEHKLLQIVSNLLLREPPPECTTNELLGKLYMGFEQHNISVCHFSSEHIELKGLDGSLNFQRHAQLTVRIQHQNAVGEIAAMVRYTGTKDDIGCFEIIGMSSRDREIYSSWLSIAA